MPRRSGSSEGDRMGVGSGMAAFGRCRAVSRRQRTVAIVSEDLIARISVQLCIHN